jgi:hypothetical protein
MMLSSPNPISETDPAMAPATIETSPSRLLYPIVKYSSRCPRRTSSRRFGVLVVATIPLSAVGETFQPDRRQNESRNGMFASEHCSPLQSTKSHCQER